MDKLIASLSKVWLAVFFTVMLAACSQSQTPTTPMLTSTPTELSSTAVVEIPSTQSQTTEMVSEPTATTLINALTPIVIEQPTQQVTTTINTAADYKLQPALLQVEKPGDSSKLASPFLVTANVYPGYDGMVNVQLFGEKGRLMFDQLLQLSSTESGWISMAAEIKFEPVAAGESALIVISTRDAYGRRITQTGIPVTLLQIGKSEIESNHFNYMPALLKSPVAGGIYKKGNLHIEGNIHLFNGNPIIVELFTQTGGILANKAIYVSAKEGADYVQFSFDMPYSVTKRTPVRFTIRQASELNPSVDVFLDSQLIYLDP